MEKTKNFVDINLLVSVLLPEAADVSNMRTVLIILHNLAVGCLSCISCLPHHTCSPSSQSLTVRRAVHCHSYDSACVNKHFPTKGATRVLTVPSAAPVHSVNCGYVRWMFSDDLLVTFLPPAIGLTYLLHGAGSFLSS